MQFENTTIEELKAIISKYLGIPPENVTVQGESTYLYLDNTSPAEFHIQAEGDFNVTVMGQVDYGFQGFSTRQYGELAHGPWIYTHALLTGRATNFVGGPRIMTLDVVPWRPRQLHTMYSCPVMGIVRESGVYRGFAIMILNEHPGWNPEGPYHTWDLSDLSAISDRIYEPVAPNLEPGQSGLYAVSVGASSQADIVVIEDALDLTSLKFYARPPIPTMEEALSVLASQPITLHNPAGDSVSFGLFGSLLKDGTIEFEAR